ncbi:MAG TPA: gephyrin-like molybdotransferase Glp [Acidimicrobiales bacterium]|nr:gephyrin-like molybdotransferase Glp [Acidimicrobiales bacterium]
MTKRHPSATLGTNEESLANEVQSMISYEEARKFVLQNLSPLTPKEIEVKDALGVVVAEVVHAREPSPRFANSAMDGFALRAEDTTDGGVRLKIVDTIFAGDLATTKVRSGEAARIMTGAPLPDGADSICMREEAAVDADGLHVLIHRTAQHGDYVRLVGDDVTVGQELVGIGTVVGPALLGVLASQGIASVVAHPRPRVGVLSTGNELSDSNDDLGAGKIRDANRPSLLASLARSGLTPVDLGIAGDTPGAITEALVHGMRVCDAVISTGGVSVGDADFVKSVLAELVGDSARSMQVAIRPGKPFAFAVDPTSGAPFFGLAGNPVSTLVGFELFVRPALRLLAGHTELDRPTASTVLNCPLPRRRDGKLNLVHVNVGFENDGRLHVKSVSRLGSHLLHAIADANAIAMVPDGDGLSTGQEVAAMIIDTERLNAL